MLTKGIRDLVLETMAAQYLLEATEVTLREAQKRLIDAQVKVKTLHEKILAEFASNEPDGSHTRLLSYDNGIYLLKLNAFVGSKDFLSALLPEALPTGK